MKKTFLLLVIFFNFSTIILSQTKKVINFGIVGVSYEIPVSKTITIAPTAFTNLDIEYLNLGVKANYYLNTIFDLPDNWDVFGGANLGFGFSVNSKSFDGFDLGLQLGARWFWNEKWAVYIEVGGGRLGKSAFGIGLTLKL